jgi:hypothetical protein
MLKAANAVTIQEATSPVASPPMKSPPDKKARRPFDFSATSSVQRSIIYPPPQ